MCGNTKDIKGGKRPKDRLTARLFLKADGSDFWKLIMIGTAKKPLCFGNRWNPGKIGMLYYNNDSAWTTREQIWSDALRRFNTSSFDQGPVLLLVDNCLAHKPLLGSSRGLAGT